MMNLCEKSVFWGGAVSKVGLMALFFFTVILGGCDKGGENLKAGNSTCMEQLHSGRALPLRSLVIDDNCAGERAVLIRSVVGRDTLEKVFVLRDSAAIAEGKPLPKDLSKAMFLRYPLQRVAVLSSAQIGYMLRLGLEDRIVAVGAGKYIADSALYAKVAVGQIAEVSPDGMNVDYEKLMALKPDLVMTFATGGSQDDYDRMEKLGIPVMLTSEWQSSSPITKARWIELFGSLFGVEKTADSINTANLLAYGAVAGNDSLPAKDCPKVLAGMSYGGVWYAPGGNSYTANLIKNAGGCYLWASDTTRELKFSIENVMALADSADVWVNPGMFGTPEEILAAEPRAAYIKAFKNKKVFQNDGRKGPGGGNDFFESAVARPAEVLWNLRTQLGATTESLPQYTQGKPKKPVSVDTSFEWYHNIF